MIYFKMEIGVPQEVTILRGNAAGTFNKYVTAEEAEKIARDEADKAVANQKFKTVNGNDIRGEGNIEIIVPTKVSELENDANYATRSEIPTKVSQLENDKEYQTLTETQTKINEAVKDKVDSEKINSIWVGTETEYDKINPKNEKILYVII